MERVLEPSVDSSVLVMPLEKRKKKTSAKTKQKRPSLIRIKHWDDRQSQTLTPEDRLRQSIARERPAWIPDYITADWDTDPYAYQTEEESMPASILHNDRLSGMHSDVKGIGKERGWLPIMDSFLLYRNEKNVRERVAPDLLIVPSLDEEALMSSYDIETQPTPLCAMEIVSPSSETKDENSHQLYVEYLKIPTSIVIWLVNDEGKFLENPSIGVWHRHPETGRAIAAKSDAEGKYYLPELQLWIGLKDNAVYFVDEVTGETLVDVGTERLMRQAERREREAAQRRAEAERREREAAQKRAEQEAQRAEQEAQRAEQEAQRAESERRERETAESEIARLRALLEQSGISI
ncbi:MAG: hypothetical protein AAF639_12805 [Chloroflexota bacterium]